MEDNSKAEERMDVARFIKMTMSSKTDDQFFDALNSTPEIFQQEILDIWNKHPESDLEQLKLLTCEGSLQSIRDIAQKLSEDRIDFRDWLKNLPLLPVYVTKPLLDNYQACKMVYINFDDCYSGFDEKSFWDDALKKIENYLDTVRSSFMKQNP